MDFRLGSVASREGLGEKVVSWLGLLAVLVLVVVMLARWAYESAGSVPEG